MKLREHLKQYNTEVPEKIIFKLGELLSDEHLKVTGERPIKTEEHFENGRVAMTNEYPEWFLSQSFDHILDQYLNILTNI